MWVLYAFKPQALHAYIFGIIFVFISTVAVNLRKDKSHNKIVKSKKGKIMDDEEVTLKLQRIIKNPIILMTVINYI